MSYAVCFVHPLLRVEVMMPDNSKQQYWYVQCDECDGAIPPEGRENRRGKLLRGEKDVEGNSRGGKRRPKRKKKKTKKRPGFRCLGDFLGGVGEGRGNRR